MTEQMHKRETALYVLVNSGRVVYTTNDINDILCEARESVYMYISDHKRHELPFKVTGDALGRMDIEVHELLGKRSQVALPYQAWIDDYYREMKEGERENKEREYKRFVELRKKWEDRFQSEQK